MIRFFILPYIFTRHNLKTGSEMKILGTKILKIILVLGVIFFSYSTLNTSVSAEGGFNKTLHTGQGEYNFSSEDKDFKANQNITIDINKSYESGLGGLFQRISQALGGDDSEAIKVEVTQEGNILSIQDTKISPSTDNIEVNTRDLTPGAYTLKVSDSSGNTFEQDFTWGVLAINTNKSLYLENEKAGIQLAVLDDKGSMVCDADVKLTIQNPRNETTILSTKDGSIIVSDTCHSKEYSLAPDYSSSYQTTSSGIYLMELTVQTQNGSYTIKDQFQVEKNVDFDVERLTATRLYPQNDYPVILGIKANKDYKGVIEEKITSRVSAYYTTGPELKSRFNLDYNLEKGLVKTLPGTDDGNEKTLKWDVNFQKGETYTLAYYIDPPAKSPDIFFLGPLKIGGWQEARMWQMANDDTTPKDWTFSSDTEGLADQGGSAFITFGYDSTDQAIKFTGAKKNSTETEFAYNSSTGSTWETWGVTPGATVTAVQITAWKDKTVVNSYLNSHNLKARIINSGGTTVHSAGDILDASLSTSIDGSYVSGSAGTQRAVDGSYQLSDTDVRLQLEYSASWANNNGADLDQRFDDIQLTITFTPPASGDTLTGKAYTDDSESSSLNSVSVCVAINSNQDPSDCNTTDGTGTFTISTSSDTSANDQLTFFLDGGTYFGNTVTKTDGNDILSGDNLRVYQNEVTVRYETGSSLTIADMDAYDDSSGGNSTDMLFDATDSTTDTLTVEDTYLLYIPSGFTFAPGGNLDNGASGGIDDIKIAGTYTSAAGESILISGSWTNTGTFTASTSTVTFDAPGASTETINSSGASVASFNNLILNDGGGGSTFQLSSALDVNGNLTITGGTLNTNGQSINLAGNYDNDDTMTMASGTFTFDATAGTKTIDADGTGNEAFYDLVFNDNGGPATFQLTTLLDVNNNLTITGGTLDVNGSNNINVGGNFANNDTFTASSGTLTMDAESGTKTIDVVGTGSSSVNNFVVNDNTGSATFQLTAALDVNGTFNLTDGILQQNGANNINTAGAVTIGSGASYQKGSGVWTFDGTGSANYTDNTATQNIGDVTIDAESSTRTVSLQTAVVMDNLTVAADGVFAMGGQNVTIGNTSDASHGDINIASGGSTSQSSGTVTILSNSGTTQWNGTGTFSVYNLTIGNGSNSFTIDNETNDLGVDLAGTFTITANATFTASSTATFEVAGSWSDSGTYNPGSGTSLVKLNATSGSPTIATSGSSFNYLELDDSGNNVTWTLSDNLDVNGNLTITGGTLSTGSNRQINIGGTFTNNDTFTANSGTVVMDGTSSAIAGSTNTAFSSLTIDPSSTGSVTLSSSNPTVAATLNVASSDTFSLGSGLSLTLGGSSTLTLSGAISGSGTLVYQSSNTFPTTGNITSLIRFDAQSGNLTIPSRTNGYEGNTELYNNSGSSRTFALGTGGGQTVSFSGNLTLNGSSGDVSITASNNPTVNISGSLAGTSGGSNENITTGTGTWTVGGNVNLTNINTFTATGGTFQMNGNGVTLTSSTKSFNNFKETGGTVQTADSMAVDGTFEVTSGTFTHAVGNMTVAGTFTITSGTFVHGGTSDVDILIGGNFTLQDGIGWTENTNSTSQVIFTGDLYYNDAQSGSKKEIGNVQIGNSPGTTWLSSDFASNSLSVVDGDYYYTCGWEVDIGNGGITIDGTFDNNRTDAGCSVSDSDETQINDGNLFNLSGTGTFVPRQSTIIFDDSSGTNNLITAGAGSFYNMEVQGAANNMVLQDALDIDNNLTLSAGVLNTGSNYQLNVGGNWVNSGGTFTESSGKVVLDGGSSVNLNSGCADADACTTQNFYDLEIAKSSSSVTVTLSSTDLRVTNTLTITTGELIQGTLDVRSEGASSAVYVDTDGEWTNTSTGDLTLGGPFANYGTVTFQGNGTSCGDTNTDLVIASTTTAQRAWSGSGTFNFNDASASWQGGTASIDNYNGYDGGNNNTNWTFGGCPVGLSGHLYGFGTTSPSGACDGNSGTYEIQLRAAGQTYSASCSNSDGSFSFPTIAGPSAGDGLVIWIDHDVATSYYGAMVVRYDGAGASDNNTFYDNAVTVTSDDTTPVDIDDFNFFDSGDDGDIPYTANNSTPDTLTLNSGFELYILKKSTVAGGSTVFDPNGTVTTNATGGDFHVGPDSKAYLDNSSSVGRNVEVDGGGILDFNASTTIGGGSITTAGTSATVSATSGNPLVTISGTGDIGGGTNPSITLYNLSTSGSGTTSITSTVNLNNNLSVGSGTTLDVKADLNVAGALTTTSTATVTSSSGTPDVTISGTGTLGGGTNAMTFYDLTTEATTVTPNSPVTVNNLLTVGDGVSANTFQVDTNDVAVTTYDLEIKASGVYSASSNVSYPLTVHRNFTKNGTFNANNGKVIFDTTNTSTLSYGSSAATFYQFTVDTPQKTVRFSSSYQTNITDTFILQGTSCTTDRVFIDSDNGTSSWSLNATGASKTVQYVNVKNSNAIAAITANDSTDGGGNSGLWTINEGTCAGAGVTETKIKGNVQLKNGVQFK